jgi:nucleoside-diphosphate-sugar epimerase
MRLLITGASGFIGSNLLDFFHNNGYIIDVIDLGQIVPYYVRMSYHWNDIETINFNNYNAVIHLAGKAHDLNRKKSFEEYFNVNVGLTKIIFTKFLNSNSLNFIYFSSIKAVAEVVQSSHVLTENVVPNPVGPYGKSKAFAEKFILDTMGDNPNILSNRNVYILRPCMIHGPGNKGNLNLLYGFVKMGLPWPLGKFNNLRSFTSLRNLEFIINSIIINNVNSGIYNICDSEALSTNDIIKLISESLGKKIVILNISKSIIRFIAKVGDLLHLPFNTFKLQKLTENYIVNNSAIKNAIGITNLPVSGEEGIMETINSFRIKK